MIKSFIEKIETFIVRYHLIKANDFVLVAVSGGMDSVVLLHSLVQLREKYDWKLKVIHLNHGIRGEQAFRDQVFVEQLAGSYGIEAILKCVAVPEFIIDHGYSEEEGARVLRYQFFEETLAQTAADVIALGHHADDQVETVIDHFMRGSGLRGLAGMAAKREKYVRPLLWATREEIETYAKTHSLQYRIDSTNEMVKYRRNRIRHELIPLLKKCFNPGIDKVVLRTAHISREAEEYLVSQAERSFEFCLINSKKNKIILDINSFLNYFTIIQKYVLFHILHLWQLDQSILTTEKIDCILALIEKQEKGKKFYLTSEVSLHIDQKQIVFMRSTTSACEFDIEKNIRYPLPGDVHDVIVTEIDVAAVKKLVDVNRCIEYIDAEKITGRLKVRNFKVGDRFRPLNMKGEKKVADFFTDLKMPLHLRGEIPFLVCDTGIIWIIGYQIDDRYKVSEKTSRILKLQIVEGNIE